jgi:hypothetical protein
MVMAATGIKSDGGFEGMQAILQGLAQGVSAAEVAPQVDAFMRGQLAAGLTPEGQAWPAKEDGGKPLKGAAAAYEQQVSGNAIVMQIGGGAKSRYAFHHFGAQEKPVRRQLPQGRMPARLGDAIRAGFVTWFQAKTKAGKRGYAYYRKRGKDPRKVG